MNIALVSSEVYPFAKTGGLADVCGALPQAFESAGAKVSVFLPRYRGIDIKQFGLKGIGHDISTVKVGENVDVYFLENLEYFDRAGLYGDKNGDFPDNLQRFQFFCWRTLELLKKLDIKADIVHCHDWQTGLIPVYLKHVFNSDPFYQKMKSVLTIHNISYQGVFPGAQFSRLKLDPKFFGQEGFEFWGQINLLKGGIVFSDRVTTVSPQYAKDIQTKEFGCGLEGALSAHKGQAAGILNGLDYNVWNPETDKLLPKPYSPEKEKEKAAIKTHLQLKSRLAGKKNIPVIGYVGRLAHQKGFDLVAEAIDELMQRDVQFVFQGVGEPKYEQLLRSISGKYSDKIATILQFDEATAHQIYAGSDLFLMPSRFEPCGLSQMISLRYGTIPIVHRTGGLADTIFPYGGPGGNGFVFTEYTKPALTGAVTQALDVYADRKKFRELVEHGSTLRFTWDKSAKEYLKVFETCLQSA